MSSKPIITIFGATGIQGGSVARIFLTDPALKAAWAVRAVTRDPSKPAAQALRDLGAAEVVAADLDDPAAVARAVHGAHTVFGVTNYWDSMSMDKETQQGKTLADAVHDAGVAHFIFSTLDNVTELSNGALPNVYHFDSKAAVTAYIRERGLRATFFLPGLYMSNLSGGMLRRHPAPAGAYTIALPVPATAPVPLFDTAGDTGKFVKAIVHAFAAAPDTLPNHARVLGAAAYVSWDDALASFRAAKPIDGKDARFMQVSDDEYRGMLVFGAGMPESQAQEMLENMLLLDGAGYYGGESLDFSLGLLRQAGETPTSFEEFARTVPAWAELK